MALAFGNGRSSVSSLFGLSAALTAICLAPWLVMLVGLPLCGPLAEQRMNCWEAAQ